MTWFCRTGAEALPEGPAKAEPSAAVPCAPDAQTAAVLALSQAVSLMLEELREGSHGNFERAQDALQRAQGSLAALLGKAALGPEALGAHVAQRADPLHSPHFGG